MSTNKNEIRNINPTFKDWTIPGPMPDTTKMDQVVLEENETLDALSGHFRIFQLKNGHRFSTDDILVAWYGTSWCPSARTVLDLGSGVGSVGMTAAWRLPYATFVTIEAQKRSVLLAKKSATYNGLTERYDIRHGDFRTPNILNENELFDLILGSPPYFPLDSGSHGDHPQKIACRFEIRGTIWDYCNVASRHLAPGGVFACIFPLQPAHQYQRVIDAASDHTLSIVRQRPIVLSENDPPLLGLFIMVKSDHLPEDMRRNTWKEPPLIIRCTDGSVHPEYRSIKLAIGFPP